MKQYRIIEQGDSYFIEKKGWFRWHILRHAIDCSGLSSITRFNSAEEAREYIEYLRPKRETPMRVVDTILIW